MNPQAACNYFKGCLGGKDLYKDYLADLFESIFQENQNLREIRDITATQIESIAQETNQRLDIQYDLETFDVLPKQQIIDDLKRILIRHAGQVAPPHPIQLFRHAVRLEIKYEWVNDMRHYPNDHSGEKTRDFDRLARIFSFSGTVCTSVSVINNQFCIAVNKWPNRVNNAHMFLNQINMRRQQILEIAGQQINALLPPNADLNTELARSNLIDALILQCEHYVNMHGREFRNFYSDNDWYRGRAIQDLVKILYIYFTTTAHEPTEYACIRNFLNGQTPPVILNTYNNLHAEIEIRNYKKYILEHTFQSQHSTSEATGVSRLCCFGCEYSLQAPDFLPMYNHVTGYHGGRYLIMNGDAIYAIQEIQQIFDHLNGQRFNDSYNLMPRVGYIQAQVPGDIVISSQPEFSHSPPSPMLENRPLPSPN